MRDAIFTAAFQAGCAVLYIFCGVLCCHDFPIAESIFLFAAGWSAGNAMQFYANNGGWF